MSFVHSSTDGAVWSHEADLASCLACSECHDRQAAAVLSVVNEAMLRRNSDEFRRFGSETRTSSEEEQT